MVKVAALLSRFLYVESCEQCVPCKFGSGEITTALERLLRGEGSADDVNKIRGRCGIVATGNRCALPVGERVVVTSILNRFADEFKAHDHTPCPHSRELTLPKLVDYDPNRQAFTYDVLQSRKQPDWTYAITPVEVVP